jgi:hypothetical protein
MRASSIASARADHVRPRRARARLGGPGLRCSCTSGVGAAASTRRWGARLPRPVRCALGNGRRESRVISNAVRKSSRAGGGGVVEKGGEGRRNFGFFGLRRFGSRILSLRASQSRRWLKPGNDADVHPVEIVISASGGSRATCLNIAYSTAWQASGGVASCVFPRPPWHGCTSSQHSHREFPTASKRLHLSYD